jgi:hypothetical protein
LIGEYLHSHYKNIWKTLKILVLCLYKINPNFFWEIFLSVNKKKLKKLKKLQHLKFASTRLKIKALGKIITQYLLTELFFPIVAFILWHFSLNFLLSTKVITYNLWFALLKW